MAKGCGKSSNFCSNKLTFDTQRYGADGAALVPTIVTSVNQLDFDQVYRYFTKTLNYDVSGSNLTNDIIITSDNVLFEISKDGGANWFASVTLFQVGGTVNSTNILVRYSPTAENADTSTISHTSVGATTKDVDCEGDAITGQITMDESEIPFGSVILGNNAIEQFTLSAVGVSTFVNINSTNPLVEVSNDNGATWFSNVNVNPDVNGTIAPTIIKMRYTPTGQANDEGFINSTSFACTQDPEGMHWTGRCIEQSIIYNEDFQSGTVTAAPIYRFPNLWTLPGAPYAPTNEWAVYFDGGVLFPLSSGSGGKSLIFANNDFAVNRTTAKPFSTIGFTGITIDLLQFRKAGAPPALTVEWSTDNATWNNAGFVDVADDEAWHSAAQMVLPVGAENKAAIYIRLSATADDGGGSDIYFVVDDLKIQGYS